MHCPNCPVGTMTEPRVCWNCYSKLDNQLDKLQERFNKKELELKELRFHLAEQAERAEQAEKERDKLKQAIIEHHSQKAQDRCILDDDKLYTAAGLPPCDRRVGSKTEMILNCVRFIDRRCEEGGWPSYQDLEREIERLRWENAGLYKAMDLLNRGFESTCDLMSDLKQKARAAIAENEQLKNKPNT